MLEGQRRECLRYRGPGLQGVSRSVYGAALRNCSLLRDFGLEFCLITRVCMVLTVLGVLGLCLLLVAQEPNPGEHGNGQTITQQDLLGTGEIDVVRRWPSISQIPSADQVILF
jgi:hypothetical protein